MIIYTGDELVMLKIAPRIISSSSLIGAGSVRNGAVTRGDIVRCLAHESKGAGGGDDAHDPLHLQKFKLAKRLFWSVMFGGTLVTAILVQRKRRLEAEEFMQHYQAIPTDLNFKDGGRSFRYKGFVFPQAFGKKVFRDIERFQAREDDIYVVSFPKTGTTWIQEIVYLIENDLNFEKANAQSLETRFPYLEFIYPGIRTINRMASPRLIKSHLPLELLPESILSKNCKIIYITRNPKDIAVSFFHFLRMLTVTDYQGSFKELVNKLIKDELPYCPFWKHVLPFWERRSDKNIMFVKYEDLHKDLRSVIYKVAEFLNKTLSEEEVDNLLEHCSFVSMQSNPMVNYNHWQELGLSKKEASKFMRKGKVGDWQNYFTPGLNVAIEDWINRNSSDTGLTFDYTIPQRSTVTENVA